MGTCHVLIGAELRDRLKGKLGQQHGVRVLKSEPYDERRFLTLIGSNELGGGDYFGFMAIIVDDAGIRFKAEGAFHEDS